MHHLQRFSRCFVSARYVAINYSSSSATQILTKDIADKSSLKTGGNAAPVNPRTKSKYLLNLNYILRAGRKQ